MNIICRNRLLVRHKDVWKVRKNDDFIVDSPWTCRTEWAAVTMVTDEGNKILEETHENDEFILCWIDYEKATKKNCTVRIDAGRFVVNKSASVDSVLEYLNAVVYFSEGALVRSPNLLGNFTSDQYLYYNDMDGMMMMDNSPYELTGRMPKAVTAKLLELLGLPTYWKAPFRFVTTKQISGSKHICIHSDNG